MYVLFKEFDVWKITPKKNYYSVVRNASKVTSLYKFENLDDILSYLENYCYIERKDIEIVEV